MVENNRYLEAKDEKKHGGTNLKTNDDQALLTMFGFAGSEC